MQPRVDEAGQGGDRKTAPGGAASKRRWGGGRRSTAAPYLFLLPFFAIYSTFLLYPTYSALWLSFQEAVALDVPTFTGLDNYVRLVQDERYLHALRNTTVYALASVFILSPLALVVAVAIRSFLVPSANLKSFYRMALFVPFVTSLVVIALMFSLVFNKDFGLLNSFFDSIGLPKLNWLRSERLAMVSIILVGIWTYLGINSLYFLAGLQNIPEELNEAAAIDGAGRWKRFRYITLPLLRPTILFVVIQATIFSYQLFELPFLLTRGGPSDATLFLSIYLYEVGFSQFDRGYAAAIGYSMALISVGLALIQLYLFPISASLKPGDELFSIPIRVFPDSLYLGNYELLFEKTSFVRWFFNSVFIGVSRMALAVTISLMAGYAFAKFDFRFKNALFILVLATLTLPIYVLIVPLYGMMVALGWTDTYIALILPVAAQAIGVFLARQYLLSIPTEIMDSARVDGAGEWSIFWRIVVPLSWPVIAVMAILFFTASWNDYIWPLVVLTQDKMFTVSLGLPTLVSPYGQEYGAVMAGSFLSTLPIMILFLIMQRRFIEGITQGALKG